MRNELCLMGTYARLMLETSARLLRLLSLLQTPREWPGPELAERLGVSTRTIRNDVAITGEVNLRGRAMPVGGIKEKVLAARRVGINEVILPKQNGKNVNEDLTPELREGLTVHLVSTIDEVLALALQPVSSDVVRPPKKVGRSTPAAAAPPRS